MSLETLATPNGSVTLPETVAEGLTMAEAVALLSELVGRRITDNRVRVMIHEKHPSTRPLLRGSEHVQGNWRFKERSVRNAARIWPREQPGRPPYKLTDEQVAEIRARWNDLQERRVSQNQLAREFGVDVAWINQIVRGIYRIKKAGGEHGDQGSGDS